MKICIIGFDGSGKTILAKKLAQDSLNADYFHPGRARRNINLLLKMIFGRKSIVCDRGYYDSFIDLYPEFLVKFERLTKLLFFAFIFVLPRFDHVFWLDLPFDTAFARKDDHLD